MCVTTADLLPQNCNCKIVFKDKKKKKDHYKTKQQMLLLGADSGGLHGPALAGGSVSGIQHRATRVWYAGLGAADGTHGVIS